MWAKFSCTYLNEGDVEHEKGGRGRVLQKAVRRTRENTVHGGALISTCEEMVLAKSRLAI